MALKFHIKTKDIDLTPQINTQITERLQDIEKYIDTSGDNEILAEVEVGLRSRHHKKGDVYRAEVNVSGDGNVYRAVTKAGSITDALDQLKTEITKVIRRRTDKQDTLTRRGGRMIKKILRRE